MSLTFPSIQIQLADGQFVDFARDQIISANVVEEINPVSVELPISTLEFTVMDLDGSLSMFSGELFDQLTERLPVVCWEFFEGDYRLIGKFYLDTWKNITAQKVEFTAIDILGILADTDFDGIFWGTPVTLPVALSSMFAAINVQYDLHEDLNEVEVSGWIPPGNYRDALQQICFAGGAMAVTARHEKLQIVPSEFPAFLFDAKINEQQARQNSIELLPLVSSIEVVSHNYTQGTETETVFDKTLEAGNHKVVFDKPYFNINIVGLGYVPLALGTEAEDYLVTEDEAFYFEAGGEFAFGSNSVYFYLTESAHITITGTQWIDSKRSFLFQEAGVTASKNKKTLIISDATLVNIDRGQAVLNRLRDYYRQRYVQDILLLPSYIKTSDIVISNTLEQRKILSSVRKMELGLTDGFYAKTELRGYLPVYVLPIENPTRCARTGIAVTGRNLTLNNRWRQYA